MSNHTSNQSFASGDDTTAMPLPTVLPRRSSRRRSRGGPAALAVVALAMGAGAGVFLAVAGARDEATGASSRGPVGTVAEAVESSSAAATAGQPESAAPSNPGTEGPAPTEPAGPGYLVVSTNHVQLGQNVFTGTFDVTNDGGSPIGWTWSANHPAISAVPNGGTLAAGESVQVQVSVHWQQLGNGGFNFPTKVVAGGQQLNVLVSGTKNVVVNPGIQLPGAKFKLG